MANLNVIYAEDLSHFDKWWNDLHGHTLMHEALPPNRFYITLDDKPVAYFGMHGMECCVCYLGFPTVSRDVRREQRRQVIKYMCEQAGKWAKHNGYKVVFLSIQGETAAQNFMNGGFMLGDEQKGATKATHLFMRF